MHSSHPFEIVSCYDVKHMLGGYEWLQVLQRGKCFTKIQPFNLSKALSHKSCLISNHHTMFILFVAEDPLGANDVLALRTLFKNPNFIAGEVVELFLYCHDPIQVLKCFIYICGFQVRNKRAMFTKRAILTSTSSYSTGRVSHDQVNGMVP